MTLAILVIYGYLLPRCVNRSLCYPSIGHGVCGNKIHGTVPVLSNRFQRLWGGSKERYQFRVRSFLAVILAILHM